MKLEDLKRANELGKLIAQRQQGVDYLKSFLSRQDTAIDNLQLHTPHESVETLRAVAALAIDRTEKEIYGAQTELDLL